MAKYCVFDFPDDLSVEIGETQLVVGETPDPQDNNKEYLVRWKGQGGKMMPCRARILAMGGNLHSYFPILI